MNILIEFPVEIINFERKPVLMFLIRADDG